MERKADAWPEDWEIIVAGFSEEHGPAIRYMASADIHGIPDIEPFKFIDTGGELCGGAMPETVQAIDPDLMADATVNGLAKIAVPLFEAMRAVPGPNPARPELPPVHGIGGHIDHTVLTMDGGRTERIHTWPDVVGEKIRPL
ncbi:MAG: hypothetical protein KKG78_02400 [Alphaproteobacteria bacterium]|nr:hypothetical protein [Alphaproteobacteria bacterium]